MWTPQLSIDTQQNSFPHKTCTPTTSDADFGQKCALCDYGTSTLSTLFWILTVSLEENSMGRAGGASISLLPLPHFQLVANAQSDNSCNGQSFRNDYAHSAQVRAHTNFAYHKWHKLPEDTHLCITVYGIVNKICTCTLANMLCWVCYTCEEFKFQVCFDIILLMTSRFSPIRSQSRLSDRSKNRNQVRTNHCALLKTGWRQMPFASFLAPTHQIFFQKVAKDKMRNPDLNSTRMEMIHCAGSWFCFPAKSKISKFFSFDNSCFFTCMSHVRLFTVCFSASWGQNFKLNKKVRAGPNAQKREDSLKVFNWKSKQDMLSLRSPK